MPFDASTVFQSRSSIKRDDVLPVIRALQAGSCPHLTHLTLEGVDTFSPHASQKLAELTVSGSIPMLESFGI